MGMGRSRDGDEIGLGTELGLGLGFGFGFGFDSGSEMGFVCTFFAFLWPVRYLFLMHVIYVHDLCYIALLYGVQINSRRLESKAGYPEHALAL